MANVAEKTNFKTCRFCSQELAHTTFYRHLNDKSGTVCPGKKRTRNQEESSDGESNIHKILQESSLELIDSTFDVDSSEESDIWYDADPEQLSPILSSSNSAFSIVSSSESVSECSLMCLLGCYISPIKTQHILICLFRLQVMKKLWKHLGVLLSHQSYHHAHHHHKRQ